jgi:hypothetical protein
VRVSPPFAAVGGRREGRKGERVEGRGNNRNFTNFT